MLSRLTVRRLSGQASLTPSSAEGLVRHCWATIAGQRFVASVALLSVEGSESSGRIISAKLGTQLEPDEFPRPWALGC